MLGTWILRLGEPSLSLASGSGDDMRLEIGVDVKRRVRLEEPGLLGLARRWTKAQFNLQKSKSFPATVLVLPIGRPRVDKY